MEYLFLTGAAVLGYLYLNQEFDQGGLKVDDGSKGGTNGLNLTPDVTTYKPIAPKKARAMFDMSEMGIQYEVGLPTALGMANLNEAYKPYSAPTQKSTYNIVDIFEDQAERQAYIEATSVPFYFNNREGSVPYVGAQQSNPLVEIPTKNSIGGDPKKTLAHYPRVYIQGGEELNKKTAEKYDKMLNAGMPETLNKKFVPLTGRLNREWNPWGNGGHLNRVFTGRQELESQKKRADRSVLMQPTMRSRLYNL